MSETPILQKVAHKLDSALGISADLQRKRLARNQQIIPKNKNSFTKDKIRKTDGSTNLTKKQYMGEVNQWIKNNPKKWAKMTANQKAGGQGRYQALQTKLTPLLGRAEWDAKGNPTTANKRLKYQIYKAGNKGSDYASAKEYSVRKATRGKRSSKTIKFIKQDFIDLGRRNGYSTQEAINKWNSFKEKNKAVFKNKAVNIDIDHLKPHALKAEYGNPGETHRNYLPAQKQLNLAKSEKLPTRGEEKILGTTSSKTAAIMAEFRGTPVPSDAVRLKIFERIAKDPNRETATQKNIRLDAASKRRLNWMQKMKYGVFGPKTNTQNNINKTTNTPKVKSSYNVRSLNFPASVDVIQSDVKLHTKPNLLNTLKAISSPTTKTFTSGFGPPIEYI